MFALPMLKGTQHIGDEGYAASLFLQGVPFACTGIAHSPVREPLLKYKTTQVRTKRF